MNGERPDYQICRTCAAWDRSRQERFGRQGLCRRAPPMNGRRSDSYNDPLWPKTDPEDWCLSWTSGPDRATQERDEFRDRWLKQVDINDQLRAELAHEKTRL